MTAHELLRSLVREPNQRYPAGAAANLALALRQRGLLRAGRKPSGRPGRPPTLYSLTKDGVARLAFYEANGCTIEKCSVCRGARSRRRNTLIEEDWRKAADVDEGELRGDGAEGPAPGEAAFVAPNATRTENRVPPGRLAPPAPTEPAT